MKAKIKHAATALAAAPLLFISARAQESPGRDRGVARRFVPAAEQGVPAPRIPPPRDARGEGFNPDLAAGSERDLELRAGAIVGQLASADPGRASDRLKVELREVLERWFDLRQRRQGQELEVLEARVARIRSLIERRQKTRGEIVAKRFEQLLIDAEGLGWDAAPVSEHSGDATSPVPPMPLGPDHPKSGSTAPVPLDPPPAGPNRP